MADICTTDNKELVLEVKQGEQRAYGFTIKQDTLPMDLTNWTVNFEVKEAPYEAIKPLIAKIVSTTSDEATQGIIYNPTGGQFKVNILAEETLLPPYDYYLIVTLTDGQQIINISGDGNTKSIFRVCRQ